MPRQVLKTSSWIPAALAALVAVAVAAGPAGVWRAHLLLAVVGVGPALMLRSRWHGTELAAAAVASGFACAAVFQAVLVAGGIIDALPLAAATLQAGCAAWLAARRHRLVVLWGTADRAAALAAIPVLALAALILVSNGPRRVEDGVAYVARGAWGGDSHYLFSLVQMTIERHAWPAENPLMAGVANHYPSLAHVGLSGLVAPTGLVAPLVLPLLLVAFHVAGIALLSFALVRRGCPPGVAATAACAVMAARADLFVFPQTNAVVFPVLMLLFWLARLFPARGGVGRAMVLVGLGGWLIAAHTVSALAAILLGAAAFGAWVTRGGGRWASPRGLGAAGAIIVLSVIFLGANRMPYADPMASDPLAHVAEVLPFVLPWVPMLAAAAALIRAARAWRREGALALFLFLAVSVVWFAVGATRNDSFTRWFMLVNTPRFLLLGVMATLPLLAIVDPAARRRWTAALALGAAVVAFDGRAILHQLIGGEETHLSAAMLEDFEHVRATTDPRARFYSGLVGGSLAAFTGRAQFGDGQSNAWGMNTISPAEHERRLRDLFLVGRPDTPLYERNAAIRRSGVDHMLMLGMFDGDEARARASFAGRFDPAMLEIAWVGRISMLLRVRGVSASSPSASGR